MWVGGCVCSASACIIFPYIAMRIIDKWGVHYDVKGVMCIDGTLSIVVSAIIQTLLQFFPSFSKSILWSVLVSCF